MKATGIVRRIDDLGRIVVPKELRRILHLEEGDPLEMFVEGTMVCLQKHSPLAESDNQLQARAFRTYISTLSQQSGSPVILCDTEKVIYAYGIKVELAGKEISEELRQNIYRKDNNQEKYFYEVSLVSGEDFNLSVGSRIIGKDNSVLGAIVFMDIDEKLGNDGVQFLLETATTYFSELID